MRPELRDNEVARQLARRATGEWRAERMLPAVRRAMDEPRTERVATSRWAALAALVGLLGVLIVLAVALPRLDLSPAAPLPTPPALVVLSTQEFAARLAAGELPTLTMLVEGRIEADDRPAIECPRPSEPCPMGVLAGVDERVQVHAFGVATDDPDGASMYLYNEEPWPHWRMPQPPIEGILALAIDRFGLVIFRGTVTQASADVIPWPPAAVANLDAESVAVDAAVIVEGWLTQVQGPIRCRPPDPGTALEGLPDKWCGNPAWIAPEPVTLDPEGYFPPGDGLSVQHDAMYLVRGDRPAVGPVQGQFIVAPRLYGGGCPDNAPPCWDWRVTGALWYHDPTSGQVPPDVATPLLPTPAATNAAETPPAEVPPASLTCTHVTRGGRPPTEPYPTLHVTDHTHRIEGCMYVWRPDALDDREPVHVTQESPSSVEILWAIDEICDSEVTIEFSGDEQAFDVAIDYSQGASCRDGGGVEGFLMWFDGAVDADSIEAYLDRPTPPPATPSARPAVRIECEEIFAPAWSGARRGEAVIVDHSGVVDGSCQWFRAVPSEMDEVTVVNPTGSQTLLEISWPVPMVCDYMPVELEIWRTAHGLLVHIDRKGMAAPETHGCRAVVGRQGVAINLSEPIMASSVETVLTTGGAAMSVVDMPSAAMTWTLSLVPGKIEYAVGESIDVEATLTYHGATGETANAWGNGYVWFRVERVDGVLRMEPVQMMICQRLEPLQAGVPRTTPFYKGGYALPDPGDPNADFLRRYWEDPELRLPAGVWQITATSSFGIGDCGQDVRLEASIIVHVR